MSIDLNGYEGSSLPLIRQALCCFLVLPGMKAYEVVLVFLSLQKLNTDGTLIFNHMQLKNIFLRMMLLSVLCGCISRTGEGADEQTRAHLQEKVELLKKAAPGSGAALLASEIETGLLGGTTPEGLSVQETEGLRFLFAYMPLNDMAQLPYAYFVKAVKEACATKTLPWGSKISPELFRHFVLPPRVNNEDLDNAREVFANELIPRVKDLSMYDAVIEVNHWCREKIVYQPTDGRTTSPVQTVNRAYGRCGEESTVTVAALRSVGIPARQVYVPRWAHTDSNHAWVEVWVDGQWYYLGACEPEPVLDRGWFTASASRAMLVNTYAYGALNPEKDPRNKGEVISQNACFTEVSTTSTYAPVKKAVVKVTDAENRPVEKAFVSFEIFNGNSLSSMADRSTDANGIVSLTTGLGTFIIETFFRKDGNDYYAARLYSVPGTDTLTIRVTRDERMGTAEGTPAVADFRITPPAETRFPETLPEEVQKAHDLKCAQDDSIRMAHIARFRFDDPAEAEAFSTALVKRGLPQKMKSRVAGLLSRTLSNGFEVEKFLEGVEPANLPLAVELMEIVRVKDLQEISAETFRDYLNGVIRLGPVYKNEDIFRQTVLNPRVGNELPVPYKTKLWEILKANGMQEPGGNQGVTDAVTSALSGIYIADAAEVNPRNYNIAPVFTASFGVADAASYADYARALFHTAGVPTRLNFISGSLQIYVNGKWEPYKLITAIEDSPARFEGSAVLKIDNKAGEAAGRQYNLQRWANGGYKSAGGFNKTGGEVEPGFYRILTGIRAADGSILARIKTFTVEPGSNQTVTAEYAPVREDEPVVIGSMDAEWKYTSQEETPTSVLQTVGRNFFMLALVEPTKEPSQHFIRELAGIGDAIRLPTIIMFSNREQMDFFFKQSYNPDSKIHYGYDSENVILKGLEKSLDTGHLAARLPVVIVADSFGNIYYKSVGYSIGIPETVSKLKLP